LRPSYNAEGALFFTLEKEAISNGRRVLVDFNRLRVITYHSKREQELVKYTETEQLHNVLAKKYCG